MRDANEEALSRYDNNQELYERAEADYLNSIDEQLNTIQEIVDDLRRYTHNQNYDFSELLEDALQSIL